MEITLHIDIAFDGIEGKSPDNILYVLKKVLEDLVKMRQNSGFNVKVIIRNIDIKATCQKQISFKEILQLLPISLN